MNTKTMLEPFADGIWTSQQPFRFFGLQLGVRMTVIDLTGSGDLLVHSPVKMSDALAGALKVLGSVRVVVAPNCWHHLFVREYLDHFPEAKIFGCPGLDSKRDDLRFDAIIENDKTYPWSSELQHHVVGGCPKLNEVVFFHEKSRTLLVTDLGLHICEDYPPLTRMMFKLMGSFNRFGWSTIEKKMLIKDKQLFSQSIARILEWDFDQIILSHGRLIRKDGKSLFEKAFAN